MCVRSTYRDLYQHWTYLISRLARTKIAVVHRKMMVLSGGCLVDIWHQRKVSGSDNLRHSVEAQPRMGSAKMLKRCFGYLTRCQATSERLRPNWKGAAVPMGKCLKCLHFRTNNQTIWQFSAMQLSKVRAAKWIGTSTNPQN